MTKPNVTKTRAPGKFALIPFCVLSGTMVGFASLPTGVAVEIEGIFAVEAAAGGRG